MLMDGYGTVSSSQSERILRVLQYIVADLEADCC